MLLYKRLLTFKQRIAENLLSDRQTEKCNESYYIFSAKLDAIFNPIAKEVKQCADWCSDYYNRDGFLLLKVHRHAYRTFFGNRVFDQRPMKFGLR